jgi:hypothetical protein
MSSVEELYKTREQAVSTMLLVHSESQIFELEYLDGYSSTTPK